MRRRNVFSLNRLLLIIRHHIQYMCLVSSRPRPKRYHWRCLSIISCQLLCAVPCCNVIHVQSLIFSIQAVLGLPFLLDPGFVTSIISFSKQVSSFLITCPKYVNFWLSPEVLYWFQRSVTPIHWFFLQSKPLSKSAADLLFQTHDVDPHLIPSKSNSRSHMWKLTKLKLSTTRS